MNLPFESELQARLKQRSHAHGVREVLEWATLPPGKLFRPKLVEALGLDAGVGTNRDLLHLGIAIELHHAYSLVHDDMPCMDNDDVRRGKATTHKQFGEWKALLAGDALLALSYAELEALRTFEAAKIRRLFHWATGPQGLILGQWIDLGLEGVGNARMLLRMHELKTARLMQIACVGVAGIAGPLTYQRTKGALRQGQQIGLVFQLLDDLDDLTADELSAHEREVNPFLLAPLEMTATLTQQVTGLQRTLSRAPHTRAFLAEYLRQSARGLIGKKEILKGRLPKVAAPLEELLTSGVFA